MRVLGLSCAAVGAALALCSSTSLSAAMPAQAQAMRGALASVGSVETVQYLWGGRRYCWYDDGWHGPGWYWCGYAYRVGLGWGGGWGWNRWAVRGHREGPREGRGGSRFEGRGGPGFEGRGGPRSEGRGGIGPSSQSGRSFSHSTTTGAPSNVQGGSRGGGPAGGMSAPGGGGGGRGPGGGSGGGAGRGGGGGGGHDRH